MRSLFLDLTILAGAAVAAIGLWWWSPAISLVFAGFVISGSAVALRLGAMERKQ